MADPSTLEILARRLNYAGLALVAAAALAFVWAVGFTRGVEGLLEGLAFSAVGLFLPGIATLWVASIVGSAAAVHPRPVRRAPPPPARWRSVAMHYFLAALGVACAAAIRYWLDPYVGAAAPYATFFLAVMLATWVGGIGPGALAVVASAIVTWTLFDASAPPDDADRWIGTVLFLTVALAVGGVTSSLRVARSAMVAMRADLERAAAAHTELERELNALADESPTLLWTCTADGRCSHVNKAWQAFTGQPLDAALGDGWQQGIHPDDVAQWRELLVSALKARRRFVVEYRRKRHDGTYRRVVDEGELRLFGERRFAGYLGRSSEPVLRESGPLR